MHAAIIIMIDNRESKGHAAPVSGQRGLYVYMRRDRRREANAFCAIKSRSNYSQNPTLTNSSGRFQLVFVEISMIELFAEFHRTTFH